MLILVQMQDGIINIDNVQLLHISQTETSYCVAAMLDDENSLVIGKYYSEARAKEVLREIFERYSAAKQYEMPEE